MVKSFTNYLNGHVNKRIQLIKNLKIFYIISALKLNSYLNMKNMI